jgi:hypothetical protein
MTACEKPESGVRFATANPSCGGPLQSELRFERENKIRVR